MVGNFTYCRYSRKSSEAKERQALSIQDQRIECERYAQREGLIIKHTFEESHTAFKPDKRPIFKEMVDSIKAGKINAIITWKEDRLCRNPKEGGEILQLLQDGVLKEIRTATGSTYTQDSDHLVLQIHFGMANQYSRNLSQNVRRGLKHKAERGEYPQPAPIGFLGVGDLKRRSIKPHPFEAPLIKEAFVLASKGNYSLQYISDYLFNKGLKTKRGKIINKSHIYRILVNPMYYGYFQFKGELYFNQGTYEPLISKSLFDQVQQALGIRSKPKVTSWNNPFNGIIHCGTCGCAVTTTIKSKFYKGTDREAVYTYHHCTHRRGNCNETRVTGKELRDMLLDKVCLIEIDQETWQLGMKLLKEKYKDEADKYMRQRRQLQMTSNSYEEKLSRLIDMRADGELTKEEFLHRKEKLLNEQARFKELLADNESSAHHWLELTEKYLSTAFEARNIMLGKNAEKKKKLILDVGENLLLKDEKIVFTFRKPYDVLLIPAYRTDMRALIDYVTNYYRENYNCVKLN